MLIETILLSGFRCFGPEPRSVSFSDEITAVVGPNASGKTALLHALAKIFGVSRAQRTVHRSDFHLAPSADPDSRDPRELFIDVLIALPELLDGTATPETIAPSFRHMRIELPNTRLYAGCAWKRVGRTTEPPKVRFRRNCSGSIH
jgi:putative ATP-dependent endonuclease of the OLD family